MRKNADIKKTSKINIKFASVLGHLVISLPKNLFIFKIFLLVRNITQEKRTKKAKISNVAIKKEYKLGLMI